MKKRMFTNQRIAICVVCLYSQISYGGDSAISYYWPQVPLEIDLSVGFEQRITFPDADVLRLGIPPEVRQKLTVQIVGNHLWLLAKEDIQPTRVVLIAEPVGRLVLQIRAQHGESFSQPIVIRSERATPEAPRHSSAIDYGYVTLTRWVVQQLYAPKRLLRDLPGIQRLPVDQSSQNIFRCAKRIPTLCAGAVSAAPIASWQTTQHFVTAVRITNTLLQPVVLDPRELHGTWRSAAFVHSKLRASGQPGDSTVLVLISDYPFDVIVR